MRDLFSLAVAAIPEGLPAVAVVGDLVKIVLRARQTRHRCGGFNVNTTLV